MEKPVTNATCSFGVFVGRFTPITRGHAANIQKMISMCGLDRCLVIIGSCNTPMTWRHLLTFGDRDDLILALFPGIKTVSLADFPDADGDWMRALDKLISLAGADPKTTTFFSGCDDDARVFREAGRKVEILDRFVGPIVSATEVRDRLVRDSNADISDLVNDEIASLVRATILRRWEEFRNR